MTKIENHAYSSMRNPNFIVDLLKNAILTIFRFPKNPKFQKWYSNHIDFIQSNHVPEHVFKPSGYHNRIPRERLRRTHLGKLHFDRNTLNFVFFWFFGFGEFRQNRIFGQSHYQIRIPRWILGMAKLLFMYNSSFVEKAANRLKKYRNCKNRIFAKNGYAEKMRARKIVVLTRIFGSGRIVWDEFWPFYVF